MVDLSALNEKQFEAVRETDGPVLVLAGAGTGKTRVLTTRIAYIVDQGLCDISRILAVTFTNKAANEMKIRISSILGDRYGSSGGNRYVGDGLWIGTFHSIALRIIRPYHEKYQRSRQFSIIDGDDQKRLIKKVLKEANIDDKQYPPGNMAYYINRWKGLLFPPDVAVKIAKKYTSEEVAARVYGLYQSVLLSMDAIDFEDIMYYCLEIFKTNESILRFYQERFQYIMVDEYQDTNSTQYMWLRMLSLLNQNICCVGDDDQSIYSWRGADIENILKFENDFKGAKIIRLEQNYRSTGNILQTANGLIENNVSRMQKSLWTESENGPPVIVKSLLNPYEESIFVSSLIESKHKNGRSFNDMAILVRATFQTRAFEDRFLALGIPYRIIGGLRFYERKEIKDIIAFMKLIVNINDGIAFERVINIPKRGVGPTSINKCFRVAKEQNISLAEAAAIVCKSKISDFFEMIEKWKKLIWKIEPHELVKNIIEDTGYVEMLKSKNTIEDEARIETLKELVNSLKEFDSITDFLDYVSLVLDNTEQTIGEKVTISTIHASKGLEYATVFIPGFEENIMPHQKTVAEKGDVGVEEERRLCYVAITRAKNEAYITLCNSRGNSFGNRFDMAWQIVTPSRFVKDLPTTSTKIL
jgi:DNA helicase-2/ATP-dependent DNA helicase PcrA